MTMKQYPISEMFEEVQGEGFFTGVLMQFIRLAGCNVGKPFPKEEYKTIKDPIEGVHDIPGLPIYTEQCTLYDGRQFACDTDYRRKEMVDTWEIIKRVRKDVYHVCITGGEPLIHNIGELISEFNFSKKIHVETSGTRDHYLAPHVWVTVSPKKDCLLSMIKRANEIKILVDETFDPYIPILALEKDTVEKVNLLDLAKEKHVYLHPVNYETSVNPKNLQLCRMWQKRFPQFILGLQLHKAMTDILIELVR